MMNMDRALMLHNKECPYGHRCKALDCMECMEEYEKVDTLASVIADKMKKIIGTAERQGV